MYARPELAITTPKTCLQTYTNPKQRLSKFRQPTTDETLTIAKKSHAVKEFDSNAFLISSFFILLRHGKEGQGRWHTLLRSSSIIFIIKSIKKETCCCPRR